jgi:WD40 repeat protein
VGGPLPLGYDFRAEQAKQVGADAVTAALLALESLPDSTASDEAQRSRPIVNEALNVLYGARLKQRERAILGGHTDSVASAVFAPDGGRILTASDDGTARLLEAFPETQTLVDRMKAEVPRCLTQEQRQRFFLEPASTRWCATMHKWPYDRATP